MAPDPTPPTIRPLGDRALVVRVGTAIDEPTRRRVQAVAERLERAALPGVVAVVRGYAEVTVHHDPLQVVHGAHGAPGGPPASAYGRLAARVAALLADLPADADDAPAGRLVELPVRYGGAHGPDLAEVAAHLGLTPDEVVARHAAGDYVVHLLGFLPGFPYLGGLDPRLATPRRAEPRTRVPAGSVGIGGAQTGVYPLASPGGWQLIGRTPLALFDPGRTPPTLLCPGDRVRFRPVDDLAFDALAAGTRR